MSTLLDRLENYTRILESKVPGVVIYAWHVGEDLRAIIADERKRREPVEMSCPSCCKGTPCVESRQMLCTVCSSEFQTPEQLDADLDAVRKARGMPAVEHKLSVAVQEGYDPDSRIVHREPNRETIEAMTDAAESRNLTEFATVDEMLADLNATDPRETSCPDGPVADSSEGYRIMPGDEDDPRDALLAQAREALALYNALIFAVETKFSTETRHETALRYIREAETRQCGEGEAIAAWKERKV